MKKNYRQPQSKCLELDCASLIADSARLSIYDDLEINLQSDILTKEAKDIDLWNNEW